MKSFEELRCSVIVETDLPQRTPYIGFLCLYCIHPCCLVIALLKIKDRFGCIHQILCLYLHLEGSLSLWLHRSSGNNTNKEPKAFFSICFQNQANDLEVL